MSNSKPISVKHAEIAIWATLGVSALAAVINRNIGAISPAEFMGNMFVYGLFCIIPYKIGQRSNAARYVYTIITVITFLMLMAAGLTADAPKLDIILSYLMLPVEGFVLYKLFMGESSLWFANQDIDRVEKQLRQ